MATAKEKKVPADVPAVQEQGAMPVPAYMQKFMQQSQADAASMAASSNSVPRMSFRGKRFRFIEDGNEEIVKDLHVDIIILGVEPDAGRFIKTYYDKPYQSGDSDPPTCSSANGVRPDNWISDPQSSLCAKCEKNVFGSATSRSGGKAKACKDGKRLWVAKVSDPTHYYGLNVPVTSLKNLSEYGKYVAKNQYPLSLVITRLSLEDDAEFPKLIFEHAGFVDEANIDSIMSLNEERPWQSVEGPILDAPAQQALPQPGATTVTPQSGTPTGGASIDDVVGDWE